jgi:hypothetical protein
MPDSPELTEAIRKIETKFRVETYLMKLGCSEEAAKLIASSPDQIAKFTYDGVDLRRKGSDLPISDDPNAKAHFLNGPFKALFAVATDKVDGDDHTQPDPALLASARAGNRTAYSILARDAFNGDAVALDKALGAKGNGDGKDAANGHDKSNSSNPFFKLRKPDGTIDKAVEANIGRMIGAMGHRKVADIAKAAKSPAAPLGLSITGMPLKP